MKLRLNSCLSSGLGYLWRDDTGRCHEIAQAESVERRDSLASALFALGKHDRCLGSGGAWRRAISRRLRFWTTTRPTVLHPAPARPPWPQPRVVAHGVQVPCQGSRLGLAEEKDKQRLFRGVWGCRFRWRHPPPRTNSGKDVT